MSTGGQSHSSSDQQTLLEKHADSFDSPEEIIEMVQQKNQLHSDFDVWEGRVENIADEITDLEYSDTVYQLTKHQQLKQDVTYEEGVEESDTQYKSRTYGELPISGPKMFTKQVKYYSTDHTYSTCSKCEGHPTHCPKCAGSTTESCSNCSEGRVSRSRVCPDCQEGKTIAGDCNKCDGKSMVDSTNTCKQCDGTGEVDSERACKRCNGSKEVNEDGETVECPECSGLIAGASGTKTVTEECSACTGNGQIPAQEPCSSCDGTGKRKTRCNTCHGSNSISEKEQCPECGGTNEQPCSKCNGSGDWCDLCEGTGKTHKHLLITAEPSTPEKQTYSPTTPPVNISEKHWKRTDETKIEPDHDDVILERQLHYELPVRKVTYQYNGAEYTAFQASGSIIFDDAPTKKTTKEDLNKDTKVNLSNESIPVKTRLTQRPTLKQALGGTIAFAGYLGVVLVAASIGTLLGQVAMGFVTLVATLLLGSRPELSMPGTVVWGSMLTLYVYDAGLSSQPLSVWGLLTIVLVAPLLVSIGFAVFGD